jgi:hypothetical protein
MTARLQRAKHREASVSVTNDCLAAGEPATNPGGGPAGTNRA